jgi:hypothetical protein
MGDMMRKAFYEEVLKPGEGLPISRRGMGVLFGSLFHFLFSGKCDHTLGHTLGFIRSYLELEEGEDRELLDYLKRHGGTCDCEVLYRVAPLVDPQGWDPRIRGRKGRCDQCTTH